MDTGMIAARYAKALLKFALEEQQFAPVAQTMEHLQQVYRQLPEFATTIDNPVLSRAQKKQLLVQAAGGDIPSCAARFFDLLLTNGRAAFLPFILPSFRALCLRHGRITEGRLTISSPADEQLMAKIKQLLATRTTDEVDLSVEVDASLGGGFVLEYDTYRLDASLQSLLRCLRRQIAE